MKKKKQEYVQLDIMAAFKGKDIIFEEKKEEVKGGLAGINPLKVPEFVPNGPP
jgi:hypothetical protein